MRITYNRLYLNKGLQVAGWLIYFILNVNFFYSFGILPFLTSVIRSLSLVLLFSSIFYINYLVLIPRFLNLNWIWLYFLLLLAIIVAGTFIRLRLEKLFVNENFPELAKIPAQRIGFVAGTIIVLLLLSTAYRLMVDHFTAQDQKREIMKEKTNAELKFLKTQINPHFLFNTLNNLYALAYSGSKQTAPGIMALSQMMRYLLYETSQEFVRLENEIAFILNYIELEKLRLENTSGVNISIDEAHPEVMVAPLIFIPFIENSFKHSRIIDDPEARIDISLRTDRGKIIFRCSNSIPEKQFKIEKSGGVGLENITQRLQLIYRRKHFIEMNNEPRQFTIDLTIDSYEN